MLLEVLLMMIIAANKVGLSGVVEVTGTPLGATFVLAGLT